MTMGVSALFQQSVDKGDTTFRQGLLTVLRKGVESFGVSLVVPIGNNSSCRKDKDMHKSIYVVRRIFLAAVVFSLIYWVVMPVLDFLVKAYCQIIIFSTIALVEQRA